MDKSTINEKAEIDKGMNKLMRHLSYSVLREMFHIRPQLLVSVLVIITAYFVVKDPTLIPLDDLNPSVASFIKNNRPTILIFMMVFNCIAVINASIGTLFLGLITFILSIILMYFGIKFYANVALAITFVNIAVYGLTGRSRR